MRTSKKYAKELKRQLGYHATWFPTTPLKLGDIGIIRKNQFRKVANIRDLGIKFDVLDDDSYSDIEHSTEGAVSITSKAEGTVLPIDSSLTKADAGFSVEFNQKNAILLRAKRTQSPSIKNQVILKETILERYKEGNWDKDWCVVTEVLNAKSATIIISSSSNSKIELKASGNVSGGSLDIADANAKFGITYSKDLSTSIVAQDSLTPLFKAAKVYDGWFTAPDFRMRKSFSPADMKKSKALELTNPFVGDFDADYDD